MNLFTNAVIDKKLLYFGLLFVFCFLLIIPLANMIININGDVFLLFSNKVFVHSLINSLCISVISSLISIVLGTMFALAFNRFHIYMHSFISIILILPMFLPTICNGTSILLLFGNNGIFVNLFHMDPIYGFSGIVFGSVLFTYPIVFLSISNILSVEPLNTYYAADILGIKKVDQFILITLPYLAKSLFNNFILVFALIISDYGIPLIVGGKIKTLAILMYENVLGLGDFTYGYIISLVMMFLSAVLIIGVPKSNLKLDSRYVESRVYIKNKLEKLVNVWLYFFASFIILLFMLFLINAFVVSFPNNMSFTFDNFKSVFYYGNGSKSLIVSIEMAILVSSLGTVLSFLLAYYNTRIRESKLLNLISTIPAALSGLVIGLSYVLFFRNSNIYRTIWILVFVNIVHLISTPYTMQKSTLSKLNSNIEIISETLGLNSYNVLFDIIIPQMVETIIDAMSYLFVSTMITISAISFLANSKFRSLALLIPQYESQQQFENIAAITLVILIVNLFAKFMFDKMKINLRRKYDR